MTQSERVVDLMIPMDNLVNDSPLFLNPAKDPASQSLVLWEQPTPSGHTVERQSVEDFSRGNGTVVEFSSQSKKFNNNNTSNTVEMKFPAPVPTEVSQTFPKIIGEVETEMTFVTDILDPILSAFQVIASEEGIEFDVLVESSELPGVMAAPKSLQEAVSNILDNAVKYVVLPKEGSPFLSNPSPRVRLRIFANTVPPVGVTILVEDNGPGIRKHERENIFKRGFRGDLTKAVEGTGIGLDISLALVQHMGGTLSLVDGRTCDDCLDGAVIALTLYR